MTASLQQLALEVISRSRSEGVYLTGAESITSGMVSSALASIPGASEVFLGSFVTYSNEFKVAGLGVSGNLIARQGAVDPEVAAQMASAARTRVAGYGMHREEKIIGFSTTGVAGPGEADGKKPGTVFVAVATSKGCIVKQLDLEGERNQVRESAASEVLALVLEQFQH